MKQKVFRKGIHPFEGKELSMDSAIKSIGASDIMVYPLSQHIGAPAKPVVSAGERVLKGQLIADSDGLISSPVHSAVSGTVIAVEKRLTVEGTKQDCIVVENDGLYETVSGFGEDRDADNLSEKEIIEIIRDAGIVGLGGAGFPTHVKLSPKNAQGIDTLIINGSECEPYLTSDYRMLLEKSTEIIDGIKAMLKLFPNAEAVVAIENNKPDAIKLFEEKTAGIEKINVLTLKTKYPQGGERQLIYSVTGRKINSKMLPADAGCIVVNVSTCFAVYEAVYKNMPQIHKVLTITGEAAKSPCNLDVPVGMSFSDVLEAAGGAYDEVVKFISGGPMMGSAMSSLDVPVVKTSSSILAFSKDDVAALPQSACIHCGRCAAACPEFLIPQMLAKSVKANDFDKFESLGGMECIGCGCCVYVCPAKIPLTQMFKLGKAKINAQRVKN